VLESSCPICTSPVLPGQSHCAGCGASLAGLPADLEITLPEEPYEDPRLSLVLEPPADEYPLGSPDGNVPPSPGLEPSAWALRPSGTGSSQRESGPSVSLRLGAKPISLTGLEGAAATPERPSGHAFEGPYVSPTTSVSVTPGPIPQPEQPPARAQAPFAAPPPIAAPLPVDVPAPFAARPIAAPAQSASPFAPPPAAAVIPQPPDATPAAAPPKESVQELVAFGLVAAGVSIGIASLFLPWAGATGIGIGTEMVAGSPPPANQWGWGMPAAFPLFLLSLPVLLGAGASDRIQARFPNFSLVVARVTDLILPIILGGLYLGVALMYMTVPANYGAGLYLGQSALALGAGLMIAGAIVTVFFPPNVDPIPD
jgi:hypothetical protein